MWMFDYLPQELGITIHRDSIQREWNGKKFFIGHGDGLGPGDRFINSLKPFFNLKFVNGFLRDYIPTLVWESQTFGVKNRVYRTLKKERNSWATKKNGYTSMLKTS